MSERISKPGDGRTGSRTTIQVKPELAAVVDVKARARSMTCCGKTRLHASGSDFLLVFVVRVVFLFRPVVRRKSGLYDQLKKIRVGRSPLGQVEHRVNHPLWVARLLEVGETKSPAGITWIDDVTDAKRQRLSPHHDLVANECCQRPSFVLPPSITHLVVVVVAVHVAAEARMKRRPCAISGVVRAVK